MPDLDDIFKPLPIPEHLDDRVTTFSMVPQWVRATVEYNTEYKRISKYYNNDLNPRLWRQPKPSNEAMQGMAAVAALEALLDEATKRRDGIATQLQLLKTALAEIEKVCA